MSDRQEPGRFDAWQVDEGPSHGFAERVVAAAMAPRPARSPRPEARSAWRAGATGAIVGALATAAVASLVLGGSNEAMQGGHRVGMRGGASGGPEAGEAAALGARTELAMGTRAMAVLEPGARVKWTGDDVEQAAGDVFYRVEKRPGGAPFVVHTPAGDVTVLGTCFRVRLNQMNARDVKVGAVGAVMGAMAFVGVYEGRVAVSHAQQSVDVRAGESAQLGPQGARATGTLADGERAMAQAAASEAARDPALVANDNLAAQVKQYTDLLAQNEASRKELEGRLKTAESRLQALVSDGAPPKNPYDLTQDDWKRMAAEGTLVARYPCLQGGDFKPSDDLLNEAGLSPDDAPALSAAYQRATQQINDVVMAACTQTVGVELASRLGPSTCDAVVRGSAKEAAVTATIERVARIRAGEVPMPALTDPSVPPLERMLLAQTGAMTAFEKDLAQTLGPDAARRVALSDALGGCQSAFRTKGHGPILPPR